MSAKKSWLPGWAQKIAKVLHEPVVGFGPAELICPVDLDEVEKKAIAAETNGAPPFELVRCIVPECGGASEWKGYNEKGQEIRRCVRCGQVTKWEAA